MGEIVDLESYRKQRRRRLVETNAAASRRGRTGNRSERDRLRPAVEPINPGRPGTEPAPQADRDDKTGE